MSVLHYMMGTPPGRLVKRGLNNILGRWTPVLNCNGMKLEFSDVTDLDCNHKAMKTGLGYSELFCARSDIRYVLDLGTNSGLFSLWLCNLNGGRVIHGLGIEGNPVMAEKAQRNFDRNSIFMNVRVGLVHDGKESKAKFHINESSVSSAMIPLVGTFCRYNRGVLEIPTLCVQKEWDSILEGKAPDLIKMDIEGSEWAWLRSSDGQGMCKSAKYIIIEWHEPLTNLVFLRECLAKTHKLVSYDSFKWIGNAYFERL